MSAIREAVHDYINLRRNLGYKLVRTEYELLRFASFMEQRQTSHITQNLALEWAQLPNGQPAWWNARLTMVRGFARHHHATDPRTEIPTPDLLPTKPRRAKPYIYSSEQINSLLQAARDMTGPKKLYNWMSTVYVCLFGLLTVTGMRLGEALGLALDDADLEAGVLTIRDSKCDRTRLIPLHDSAIKALGDYVEQRGHHFTDQSVADNLFVSSRGTAMHHQNVQQMFRVLSYRTGLRKAESGRGPRIHDFRHTFAVRTMQNWYRQEIDPETMLPVLSTYLGHVCVSHTYWYLDNSPELMQEAMKRLDSRWEDMP